MKVLLVDDDRRLAASLAPRPVGRGFTVETEFDGPGGLWRATEGSFDAIVLDIMLPGGTGSSSAATCESRRLDADPHAHREGRGARRVEDARHRRRRLPRQAVLSSCSSRAFARCAVAPAAPRPVGVGNLDVDPRTLRALVDGREVPLTAREFDVLAYLVHRAGESLEAPHHRGRLERRLRRRPNIVEVYIGRLRRKLASLGCRAVIVTIGAPGIASRSAEVPAC